MASKNWLQKRYKKKAPSRTFLSLSSPSMTDTSQSADKDLGGMPSRNLPLVARDNEDDKIKRLRTKKPGKEEEKVYRTFPPHDPDIRFRAIYELPTLMTGRLCAKLITLERVQSFISRLDDVIEVDDEIEGLQAHSHKLVQAAYQVYKTEAPRKDIYFTNQKFCFTRVINAYNEVKSQLEQSSELSDSAFDFLQAMLEIVGCIILNPGILAHCETNEDGVSLIGLKTNFFASSWASNKIPKIFWKTDESGVEAILRNEDGRWVGIPFNYKPESRRPNDSSDPGKDPSNGGAPSDDAG